MLVPVKRARALPGDAVGPACSPTTKRVRRHESAPPATLGPPVTGALAEILREKIIDKTLPRSRVAGTWTCPVSNRAGDDHTLLCGLARDAGDVAGVIAFKKETLRCDSRSTPGKRRQTDPPLPPQVNASSTSSLNSPASRRTARARQPMTTTAWRSSRSERAGRVPVCLKTDVRGLRPTCPAHITTLRHARHLSPTSPRPLATLRRALGLRKEYHDAWYRLCLSPPRKTQSPPLSYLPT